MTKRENIIAIIGGATCTEGESELAEQVGYLLAKQGVVVVTGGRGGVMEAASRGGAKGGGLTIGILPGDDHDAGNDYVQIVIPTGLGHMRNAIVAQAGEAVIAIGGSYGTLSEISIALKVGRSVIGLGSWEAKDGQKQDLDIVVAQSADEAVNLALQELGK